MKKKLVLVCLILSSTQSFLQDLNLGLVGYFPFNGNSDDLSVFNMDGIPSNATLDVGLGNEANGSYYFNGTNAYIDCGVNNRNITDVVTISYWIKTSSNIAQFTVSKYNFTEDAGYFSVLENGLAGTAGRDGSGSFIFSDYGTTNVADGEWHHVVSVVNQNEWEVWVDCNLESSFTTSTGSPSIAGTEPLIIGKWGYENSDHTIGNIDEVRIYNRTLTIAEMELLCDEGQFFVRLGENDIDNISVYPNPTNSSVSIGLNQGDKIEIYDSSGKLIYLQDDCTTTAIIVDVSKWSTGSYIVRIISSDGIRSRRIVVQ